MCAFVEVGGGFRIIAVLQSRKSDHDVSKSDFYQTIFLSKIRPKADPNSLFFRSKSDLFQKPSSDMKHRNFYLRKKTTIVKELFQ